MENLYQAKSGYSFTFRRNNERFARTFEVQSQPVWEDYTDFDGLCVPLDIIKRMRDTARALESPWEGRCIQIKADAWKVLTDWRDAELAKRGRKI